MKPQYIIIPTLLLTLGITLPVMAQEGTVRAEVEVKRPEQRLPVGPMRPLLKEEAEARRANIKEVRENIKAEVKENREELRDRKGQLKGEIKDLRGSTTSAALKEKREDARAEIKEKRMENRAESLKVRVSMITRVLSATADRLNMIIGRIESRLSKIETAGGVSTEARASVNAAKLNLVEVRTHVTAIGALDLSGSTSTVAASVKEVNTHMKEARAALIKAQENLRKTVSFIKDLEKTVRVSESVESGSNIQ